MGPTSYKFSRPPIYTIWKNGSFRNTENLRYMKTADSVLLSLFMRTNGKCNNSHAPWHLNPANTCKAPGIQTGHAQ